MSKYMTRLQRLREAQRMPDGELQTRPDFARRVGISSMSIRNYEAGYSCKSLATRRAIAAALDVSVERLFNSGGEARSI